MQANCNTYMFLCTALYLSAAGLADYFFTAAEDCLPGGPHFS